MEYEFYGNKTRNDRIMAKIKKNDRKRTKNTSEWADGIDFLGLII